MFRRVVAGRAVRIVRSSVLLAVLSLLGKDVLAQVCGSSGTPVKEAPGPQSTPSFTETEWRKRLHSSAGCERGVNVYPLGDSRYIVEVVCQGGAHIQDMELFLYDEQVKPAKVRRLRFPMKTIDEAGKQVEARVEDVSGYCEYDEQKKHLLIYSTFLNHEECAELHTYEFETGVPRLVSYRPRNTECD